MPDAPGGSGVNGPSGNSGSETTGQSGSANMNEPASTLSIRGSQVPVGATPPNMSANTEALASQEKSTKAIEDALQEMSKTSKDLGRTFQVLEDVLKSMAKQIEGMNKDVDRSGRKWREIDVSITSVVRSVDDAETSFRNILRLQDQISRNPGFFNTKSIAEAKKFYADILKQSERISKVGLGTHGMAELKIVTDNARKSMELLEKSKSKALSDKDAKKLATMLEDINDQIIDMSDNVKQVKFSVWGDSIKKVGRAFEDSFDKRFSQTVFGQLVMGKFGPHIEKLKNIAKLKDFGERLQGISRQQREESYERLQKKLGPDHPVTRALAQERAKAAEKTRAVSPAAQTQPTAISPAAAKDKDKSKGKGKGKGKATGKGKGAGKGAGEDKATVDTKTGRKRALPKGAVSKMLMGTGGGDGLTNAVANAANATDAASGGWLQRKLLGFATKNALSVLGEDAAVGGLKGLAGKGAMSLLSAGGEAAATGVGTAVSGGIIGGIGTILTDVNPITAAIGAIISARDLVVKENKDMMDALGGAGLTANGNNFTAARKTLMSTETVDKTLYGLGTYKQNLEMMSTLGQHGYSVADIANENQRPDLGKAMQPETGGFYGSLMKNVQYYGGNVGMGTQQSTSLTMKLADEYRMTMEKTSEFFLQIDAAQRTAGLSAGKYVQIVEEINGQFDEFNKGLRTTTALLNVLGRSGHMTGDQLKDMVKNLTANPQQNLAQRMVSAQHLVESGGNIRVANLLEEDIKASIDNAINAIQSAAKHAGLESTAPTFNGNNQAEVFRWFDANKDKLNPQDVKNAAGAMQVAKEKKFRQGVAVDAFRSGNVGEIAGSLDFVGQNPDTNMIMVRQGLQTLLEQTGVLKKGGNLAELISSPDKLRAAFKDKALVSAAMQQNSVFSGKSADENMKTIESLRSLYLEGASKITSVGLSAINAQPMSSAKNIAAGMSPNEVAALAEAAKSTGLAGGDEDNNSAAQKIIEFMKNDPSGQKTNDLLMKSQDLLDKLSTSSSAIVKLMSETLSAEQARDKRKGTALLTRESADIYADAFAALFMKLVDAISTLGKVFNYKEWKKYFGVEDNLEKNQTQEAGNAANEMLPIITKLREGKGSNDDAIQTFLGKARSGKMSVEDMRAFNNYVNKKYGNDVSQDDKNTIASRLLKGEAVAGGRTAVDAIAISRGLNGQMVDNVHGDVLEASGYGLNIKPAAPLSRVDLENGDVRRQAADTQRAEDLQKIVQAALSNSNTSVVNGTLQTSNSELIKSLLVKEKELNNEYGSGTAKHETRGTTTVFMYPTTKVQQLMDKVPANSGEAPVWMANL